MRNFVLVESVQKISRIWAARRNHEISVQVEYQKYEDRGCTILQLTRVTELAQAS